MQDDISTTGGRTERQSGKGKKNLNGKWASKDISNMDNESSTASSFDSDASSDVSSDVSSGMSAEGMMSSARGVYDNVVSRGSDLMSKVDLSRGTGVIREYPIQAAVGGLIVGFILGAAVCRRQA